MRLPFRQSVTSYYASADERGTLKYPDQEKFSSLPRGAHFICFYSNYRIYQKESIMQKQMPVCALKKKKKKLCAQKMALQNVWVFDGSVCFVAHPCTPHFRCTHALRKVFMAPLPKHTDANTPAGMKSTVSVVPLISVLLAHVSPSLRSSWEVWQRLMRASLVTVGVGGFQMQPQQHFPYTNFFFY